MFFISYIINNQSHDISIYFSCSNFNGKEKDYESGFHYYGARYYCSEVLTGWLSVDSMMDKYPSISPYVYCVWNPVRLVDPDGNKVRFAPGTSEEFKKQFAETIKYMNSKGTGGIFAEIESRSETIYVTDIKNKKVSCFNSKDNTVYWNPTMGGVTDEGVTLSPATILNHEADHALQHVKNPAQRKQDLNTSDPDYDNLEEKRVITGSEQETARKHGEIKGNEVTRKNHNGSKYETISPTSTIGKKEIKIEG